MTSARNAVLAIYTRMVGKRDDIQKWARRRSNSDPLEADFWPGMQKPGLNGDVVAAKMKRVKSHVPIMLLSAYGPLSKRKLAAVDTFLSKSQPPKILLSRLQILLNRRPRPFFSRWFDTWRSRNEGVRQ